MTPSYVCPVGASTYLLSRKESRVASEIDGGTTLHTVFLKLVAFFPPFYYVLSALGDQTAATAGPLPQRSAKIHVVLIEVYMKMGIHIYIYIYA